MAPETVAAVIERACGLFLPEPGLEITLEANPTSVEADRFAAYRDAGVNRVSLGVQALDDAALRLLGREHDVAEALRALQVAARFFPRWSFDLIYARPGQTTTDWEKELARALALGSEHLSVYQLTIEEGTRFHALHREGRLLVLDEDEEAELFELTQEMLEAAGLPAYEVSNHARPGEQSRHNLVYWRYGDYAGIGPGAHGRLTLGEQRVATGTERVPERWLDRVERTGTGSILEEVIAPAVQVTEALMMGLRLHEGVGLDRLETLGRRPWYELLDDRQLARLSGAGYLERNGPRLRATRAGQQRLNAMLPYLLRTGD